MRNLLLLLILCSSICFFSCNSMEKQRTKAQKELLKSEIRIDSIMFGLCFGDSPDNTKRILDEFSSHCPGEFEFHFRYPKDLNPYKWEFSSVLGCCFYNDSLYCITIMADVPSYKWERCLADLDTLYSSKYGTPIRDKFKSEPMIDWYKGNLYVSIRTVKSDTDYINDYVRITYEDMNMKIEYPIYKSVNKKKYGFMLNYGKEYWDRTYKDTEDVLMNEALKDI